MNNISNTQKKEKSPPVITVYRSIRTRHQRNVDIALACIAIVCIVVLAGLLIYVKKDKDISLSLDIFRNIGEQGLMNFINENLKVLSILVMCILLPVCAVICTLRLMTRERIMSLYCKYFWHEFVPLSQKKKSAWVIFGLVCLGLAVTVAGVVFFIYQLFIAVKPYHNLSGWVFFGGLLISIGLCILLVIELKKELRIYFGKDILQPDMNTLGFWGMNAAYCDRILLLAIIVLAVYGLLVLASVSPHSAITQNASGMTYVKNNLKWGLIGFGFMYLFSFVNPRLHKLGGYFLYIVFIPLLFIAALAGERGLGRIQPQEFAKIAMVISLSAIIAQSGNKFKQKEVFSKNGFCDFVWKYILWGAIIVVPAVLAFFTDSSSAGLLIAFIGLVIIFSSDISKKDKGFIFIIVLSLFVLFVIGVIMFRNSDNQFAKMYERCEKSISSFGYAMHVLITGEIPESGKFAAANSQVYNAIIAVARGGFKGVGAGQSIFKRGYIPVADSDMLFSVYAEETGFIGVLFLLALYGFILYRVLLAANKSRDMVSKAICRGIAIHLAMQVILHILINCGLFFNTGVVLPLVCHGGSAMIANLIEFGFVLGVTRKNNLEEKRKCH